VLKSTDTTSPYSFAWDTLTYSNASHSLVSKAYDAANNVGTSATVTVTVSNGGGCTTAELLSNGGFEGSSSPWVLAGSFSWSTGAYPHSGSGYTLGGGVNNGSGTNYQQVTIPSSACGNLTFWLNVTSSETTTTTKYDFLYVEVRNTSGVLLTTLATYSNLDKGTAGVYSLKTASLAAYKGQTVRIQFRATTDVSLISTFRVDDVSIK